MKKFLNNPKDFVDEMLEGIYFAHGEVIEPANGELRCLVSKYKKKGKIGIATGGGSGHLPLFLGYVGKGMLDGCAVGGVFQSPSSDEMLSVTKEIDSGQGVLYIYGNYNGDIFNFDMAAEMAEMEDIRVKTVVAGEDVATGPRPVLGEKNIRRGVAGIFFVYKIAGAAAEEMLTLDEVYQLALEASERVASMGVALSPCIVPRIGHASFEIGENEMEIGMGIHGETGIRRGELKQADEIVDEVLPLLISDLNLAENDEVAVLINGLGSTPLEEQYIINRRVTETLSDRKIKVFKTYVGEYATSLEMAGVSISLFHLNETMKKYLLLPADTPMFKQF